MMKKLISTGLGCMAVICILIIVPPLVVIVFLGSVIEWHKNDSQQKFQIETQVKSQLEEIIRANQPTKAVDLILDQQYWQKQHIKLHDGIWFWPIYQLSEEYPTFALALQDECKSVQVASPQTSPKNEIWNTLYCDTLTKRFQNKLKFEKNLEKMIVNGQSQKAVDLIADTQSWGYEQFWGSQNINLDSAMFRWSVYTLASKYPAFETAWWKKCRSVQQIVPFDASIPDATSKPQNQKGQIRLPPDSQERSASYVWGVLYCDAFENIYDW